MKSAIKKTFSVCLLASLNSAAIALDPQVLEMGKFDVTPTISLSVAQNDNIFLGSQDVIDSTIWTLSPNVVAETEFNNNELSIEFNVESGKYTDSSEDDYTDWQIATNLDRRISANSSITLTAGYDDSHEDRGTGYSEGEDLPEEPSAFNTQSYGLQYEYGTMESNGRIQLNLLYSARDYERDSGIEPEIPQNFDSIEARTSFFLNTMPNADVQFQYRYRDADYELDSLSSMGSRDSEEHYLLAGIELRAGQTLSGGLLVGIGEITYSSPQRPTERTPSWDIDLTWMRYTYSVFTLTASQSFTEANNVGNSSKNSSFSLGWQHGWTQRFSSTIIINHEEDSFGGTDREDKANSGDLTFSYAFRRWMDLSLSFSATSQESSDDIFEYDQRVISIGIQASL